ncbi:MAG: TolC family protein [Planctomycetota bacterium]
MTPYRHSLPEEIRLAPALRRGMGALALLALLGPLHGCSLSDWTGAGHPQNPSPASVAEAAEHTRYEPSPSASGEATEPRSGQSPSPASSEAVEEALPESGPLEMTLDEAVLLALENNTSFRVERLNPAIRRTYEREERAAFDAILSADLSREFLRSEERTETGAVDPAITRLGERATTRQAALGIEETLPTGTTLSLSAERTLEETDSDPSDAGNYETLSATSLYDATVTQSLLRGFGPGVNLARLRQARVDTRISEYELRGAAESLAAEVEETGWDYILAGRRIEIYEESLKLAEGQRDEVRERIQIGRLPDIELAAVEAEVAQRREDLINARSALAVTRLDLLRLLGEQGAGRWTRQVALSDKPSVPEDELAPAERHVEVALRERPDLAESRLRLERGELEIVRTRNGLLPRLDFFITLGQTRYAESFGSTHADKDGHERTVEAGLSLEYALGSRGERARHDRAVFSLQQAKEAFRNMEELVQVDVRTAVLEVRRTGEQIEATRATRKHREESLRAESEKLRVGKSTTILVAQAQRDLVAARIAEIGVVINHLKARIELYRLEGTLLERRGIRFAAP